MVECHSLLSGKGASFLLWGEPGGARFFSFFFPGGTTPFDKANARAGQVLLTPQQAQDKNRNRSCRPGGIQDEHRNTGSWTGREPGPEAKKRQGLAGSAAGGSGAGADDFK